MTIATTKRITYYAAAFENGLWVELLVVRENGRQVSQEPTGVTYRTDRAMRATLGEKNRP